MSNASPNAFASQSDVVFSVECYPSDVHTVLLNPMSRALSGLRKGGVLVDMTIIEPSLAEEIAKADYSKKCLSIDAPISSGDLGAQNGQLAIFARRDEATVKRLGLLFSMMSKVNFMGSSGKGQFAKLANQITIDLMLCLVEGLIYARKAGLDVKKFLEVISTRTTGSYSIDLYGDRILKMDFDPRVYFD